VTGSSRIKVIVGVVIGALGALIVLQNLQRVDTMILFWRVTLPHAALLAIVFAAGLAMGAAFAVMNFARCRKGGAAT
jgi:uncharacterized integral membrane protein